RVHGGGGVAVVPVVGAVGLDPADEGFAGGVQADGLGVAFHRRRVLRGGGAVGGLVLGQVLPLGSAEVLLVVAINRLTAPCVVARHQLRRRHAVVDRPVAVGY